MKFAKSFVPVLLSIVFVVGLLTLTAGCARKPPVITKIDPASGPLGGGTTITISGTGFKVGDTVSVGGVPATGVTVKPGKVSTITATTPAGTATGPVDVIVASKDGKVKSAAKTFTYYEDVAVTMTNPESGAEVDAPAKIDVTFNQDIAADSVSISVADAEGTAVEGTVAQDAVSISVADAEGTAVEGTVAQDAVDAKMFSFTPAAPLAGGKEYTVTVSGAKGMYENVIPQDYTFNFKVKEAKAAKKGKK